MMSGKYITTDTQGTLVHADKPLQKFHIQKTEENYYRLVEAESGLAITIPDNKSDNGIQLVLAPYKGAEGQQWTIESDIDDLLTIRSRASRKTMENNIGAGKIALWDNNGGDNQKWILKP